MILKQIDKPAQVISLMGPGITGETYGTCLVSPVSTNHTIRLKRLASFFKFLNSFTQSRLASLNGNVQAVALLAERSLPTPEICSLNHNRGKIFKFISKCVFNTKDEING